MPPRVYRLRGLRDSRRLACRQVEPRRHDRGVFYRHRPEFYADGLANTRCKSHRADPDRHFAAIYHPVGLAMVVQGRDKTGMPLAINGVFGNLGVASAALLTGFLIDSAGWRSAFYLPGLVSILLGSSTGFSSRAHSRRQAAC